MATRSMTGVVIFGLLGVAHAQAGTAVFKANVPNGTLQFPSIVGFGVGDGDDPMSAFEVEVGDGMSGNDVVTTMELELEGFSTFEGTVAGKTLTVEDVCDAFVEGPAEVDLSLQMDLAGCHGSPPELPDLPYAIERRPVRSVTLMLSGASGVHVAPPGGGTLSAVLRFDRAELWVDVTFQGGLTVAALNRRLHEALAQRFMPPGVRYVGLAGGRPTFETEARALSLQLGIRTTADPGLRAGLLTARPYRSTAR
jgi:hypothetical protein